MNLHWAYPFETSLRREVMRMDADGVMHLDEALLADIVGVDTVPDEEEYDIDFEVRPGSHFD